MPATPAINLSGLTPTMVVAAVRHIPTAPRVLPPLKRLLLNGDSSIEEITALLRLDPGLSARVIQTGNSIFYNRGQRCHSVEAAIGRVGFDKIYNLVSNAVAAEVLIRPLATYGFEADELWQRSVVCAIAADVLAEQLQLDRDTAYTLGLLHCVGLVAIDEWARTRHPTLRFNLGLPPLESAVQERAVLGFDHAEVGSALLRHWNYPADMAESIRWQLRPRSSPAPQPFTSVVHLARHLRAAAFPGSPDFGPPDDALLRQLSLDASTFDDVQARVATRIAEACSLLESGSPAPTPVGFPGGTRHIEDFAGTRTDAVPGSVSALRAD